MDNIGKLRCIIHLPDYHKSNPYQDLLLSNLSKIGVHTQYGKRKIYFSNIDLSILYNFFKNSKIDILHLHWQHPFMMHKNFMLMLMRSILFVFQLAIIKCFNVKVVWTVHNLKNHENKFVGMELFFSRLIALLADGIIAHCNASKNEIINIFRIKKEKIHVIKHGSYISVYREKHTRIQSRKILQVDDEEFVFLFLGLIRPYKGIIQLMESFKQIDDPSAKLIIAGRIEDKEHAEILKEKASGIKNIVLKLQYIDDDDIEIYMKAADAMVLPYRDIMNSGSAILGMSFAKTIISPRLGCIPEVLTPEGSILYDPKNENGLKKALKKVVSQKDKAEFMGKSNYKLAKQLRWDKIALSTALLYSRCKSNKTI